MIILFVGFLLVRSIITDRTTGVIKRIFAAPISTFSYLAQNLLAYQLILLLQIILIILLGMLLYDWTLLLSLQLFLCYTVFGASSIAFTLAWNSFFTNKEISDAVFGAVSSLMGLLGGVYIPLNLLPHFLGRIGMVFPTYWISNALLALFEENHTTYLLSILMLLLFTLAFLIFGSKRRLS
jgi:ABC-2 type transport system permease protein